MARRILLNLLLLVLCLTATGQSRNSLRDPGFVSRIVGTPTGGGGGGTTWLLEENWDSTTEDTGWTYTGTYDNDYTTTVLEGSQSIWLDGAATEATVLKSFTADSEVWAYFMYWKNENPGANVDIFAIRDSGGNNLLRLQLRTSGAIRIFQGTTGDSTTTTVGTIANSTLTHIWVHYKADPAGGAAEGVAEIWMDVDGDGSATKPASSGNYYEIAPAGDATADAEQFYGRGTVSSSHQSIFDKCRVDDVEIGSDPT